MPDLLGTPGLLEAPVLLAAIGLFGVPGLLNELDLLAVPGLFSAVVCLKDVFCLLGFIFLLSLLIGAPPSSGGFILPLIFCGLGLLVLLGLFLKSLFRFLGFAISWIGGFAGLLIDGVVLFWKVLLSGLKFCDGLLFEFWFWIFSWDWEVLIVLELFWFLDWFGIFFRVSGLFRGLINNGFLFGLSLRDLPFSGDLSSLFCL